MSGIIRAPRPERGWTEIQNSVLRDERISYRARGVLARLLSNRDGFRMTAIDLARESPGEGRQAILAALAELRRAGYIVQRRLQDASGRWRTETYVYDTPQTTEVTEVTEVRLPDSGLPDVGSPDAGSPDRIEKNQEKKQEKEHKKNHPLERERGPTPPRTRGAKSPALSERGGKSRSRSTYTTDPLTGISLQEGNEADSRSLSEIRRHSPAAIEAAVAEAAAADPSGRAYPTSVLRLLRRQQRAASPASGPAGPAWAAVAAPAAPREIDITHLAHLGETL